MISIKKKEDNKSASPWHLDVSELNVLKKIKFLLGCDLTAKSLECKY